MALATPKAFRSMLAEPVVAPAAAAPVAPPSDPAIYPELRNLTKVYVVSPAGNNRNPGSRELPFRTISQAARMLQPGEGVLVGHGTYRDRVSPERGGVASKPIVYFAKPGHQVFIKGSDVWQLAWRRVKDRIFAAVPEESFFTDDVYLDSANPLRVAITRPICCRIRSNPTVFAGGRTVAAMRSTTDWRSQWRGGNMGACFELSTGKI